MVQVSFGDPLGALIDTMKSLKDLGLEVVEGTVITVTEGSLTETKFLITGLLLCIETADRPGLLLEFIKIMADINVTMESAEIDTEGSVAKDKFHVSYRGAALNSFLSQVLINCLCYDLRRPETDEDSCCR